MISNFFMLCLTLTIVKISGDLAQSDLIDAHLAYGEISCAWRSRISMEGGSIKFLKMRKTTKKQKEKKEKLPGSANIGLDSQKLTDLRSL